MKPEQITPEFVAHTLKTSRQVLTFDELWRNFICRRISNMGTEPNNEHWVASLTSMVKAEELGLIIRCSTDLRNPVPFRAE